MVGDDLKNDIFGAQQLGVKAIHVQKGFKITPNGGLDVIPDKSITNLMEIRSIVQEWNTP